MMTPLEVIISSLPIFGRANIALKKIEDLGLSLASRTSERSPEIPSDPATCVESIELAGVTHTYYREGDDQHFVLGPIDLKLFTNEVVFLVGPNGCGKTTLAKLLVGLYFPEEGEIRLNGKPVTDESRREYRENFSVVFSDFFVFEQLLGLESPRLDEQARDYLARLQLNHKVQVVEGGLSTTELSQGQRKRLALLTAYLEDRPIYLFDEWAADQDPLFKEIFYHQLLPELKARGKTVIVITHDDRYYSVADRLVKLEYGRIELDSYAATASMPAAL
jgi:putative ATP-binding cassette transporter